jgi:hypothetical protein
MAWEKIILLVTVDGEADEAAQRVCVLKEELVAMRRAWDVAEEKISSLVAKVVAVD